MGRSLITGANRGIGLELTRQLSARGDAVLAVCRRCSTELAELPVRVLDGIDVSEDHSVRELANRLEGVELDLVIHNAGILTVESIDDLDLDRIRQQFEVNTLGPLRVTAALLDNFRRGSKIAIVTSAMGSIGDGPSGGYYGYRLSKAAVNMVGANLARDLESRGVAVAILHPGLVSTEMTGYRGTAPAESAAGLIRRIDELTPATSGTFRHADGRTLPW